MNYDPNLTNCGRTARQTVELVFQMWEYKATRTVVVRGNCTGHSVIESALHTVEEELGFDEGELVLTNEKGDTNTVELWEFKLEDMLVGARITHIEPAND